MQEGLDMPKAVRFYELGGPEVLRLEDVTVPEPGQGEVKLKVTAVGLNRAESMYCRGVYMEQPQLPSGLGYEVVGTVTAVGPDVDKALVGKQIGTVPGYSMNKYPVLGEEAVVPFASVAELPASLSAVECAAVWMQYGTAYGALVELGKVGPGDFVIITAASSSVGLAAIQIVKAQGGTAIATTRTSAKKQQLLELGADHVIATEEEDLPARVEEITAGKLARIVFDPVGGDYVNVLGQATAREGTIFLYGMLSGKPTPYPLGAFGKGVALTGYTLLQMKTPERFPQMKKYIYDKLADGTFKPKVDRTFALSEIVDAYTYLESNQQVGKIVITV
jgi:NADPH:quinone reductase-like Zn-dependent oxidoreductase